MTKRAWLTKETIPNTTKKFTICLPDSELWQADFLGAFLNLAHPENWEEIGSLSQDEMADYWLSIFQLFERGECSMFEPGFLMAFAGDTIPEGWLVCDGSLVLRADYPALFEAIGEIYGAGNGSTNFGLPDLSGRAAFGRNSMDTENFGLGVYGGQPDVTLTVGQLPAHHHRQADAVNAGTANVSYGMSGAVNGFIGNTQTFDTGGGEAHDNMPPYVAINWLIKT
jgi:microcystin-dependent protein